MGQINKRGADHVGVGVVLVVSYIAIIVWQEHVSSRHRPSLPTQPAANRRHLTAGAGHVARLLHKSSVGQSGR